MRLPVLLKFAVLFLLPLGAARTQDGFLTSPDPRDAAIVARTFLENQKTNWGLTRADLAELRIKDRFTGRNGITYLYFYQYFQGIEVFNAVFNASVMPDGRILHVGQRLVANLDRISEISPSLNPEEALLAAARQIGIHTESAVSVKETAVGPQLRGLFHGGDISRDDIPFQLMYAPRGPEEVALAWRMVIRPHHGQDWWDLMVHAADGSLLVKNNWTVHDRWEVKTNGNPLAIRQDQRPLKRGGDAYRVLPPPVESPNHGPFATVTGPADPAASPFAWHDTDGLVGGEFTITRGNNVHAFPDRDGDGSPSGGEPDGFNGGGPLLFDFLPDFDLQPIGNVLPATVNLYYWNNLMHDVFYHLGFDEAGGNFQENNYGNGGTGGDGVLARAQMGADFGVRDNAQFSTPPDGSNPLMNMFEFSAPALLRIDAPAAIAGGYGAGSATFGAELDVAGIEGTVELADDGTANGSEGCQTLIGFTPGNIALIDRGNCDFSLKVLNAENAGAAGAIVINNQGDDLVNMGPGQFGSQVNIASLFIGQSDGQAIKAEPTNTVQGSLLTTAPRRDSSFDNGVIAHEYGHGLSNRSVGGPSNVNCLQNEEHPGEGWSDFFALAMTHLPTNHPLTGRGMGTYVNYEPIDGPGIRPFPYSADVHTNPATYDSIKTLTAPHGVGFVWATMLWELYWGLILEHGYDPDLIDGVGGNRIALQLVMEGMRIQACTPTFVDCREGILAADLALFGGANSCIVWRAFAKRGLGVSAFAGSPFSRGDGIEAFDMPGNCPPCPVLGIDQQPQPITVCAGENVLLELTATGDDLFYQWRRDGAPITGATETGFMVNVTQATAGVYDCVVSNLCSQTLSNAVAVATANLIYEPTLLPTWRQSFPPPACDDLNGNGILDAQDMTKIINQSP